MSVKKNNLKSIQCVLRYYFCIFFAFLSKVTLRLLPENDAEGTCKYHSEECSSTHSSQQRVYLVGCGSGGTAVPPWLSQVVVVEEKCEAAAPVGSGDELHDDLHHLLAGAKNQLTARRPVGPTEPGGEGDEV